MRRTGRLAICALALWLGWLGGGGSVLAQDSKTAEKIVYLTFDDGPSKNTIQVLDLLKKEGIKATFFVLGEQVERNPEIAKRIVDEGHAIGNHSYNHVYKQLYGSFTEFADQIMKTDDAIFKATKVRTTLVRAPGGTYTNFDQGYFDALAAAGYRVHDWNVDSGDSKRSGVPAAEIIATMKGSKLSDTLNVLLHDGSGHEESVKALPAIIDYYKSKGYSFALLDEKVEPIQFKTANKLKWNRPAVTEKQKAALVRYSESIDRSARRQPGLVLHRGERRLELGTEEYSLVKGTIYVPLPKLVEWLGGSVELDKKKGSAVIALNGKRRVWVIDGDGAEQPGRELEVPIRATLAEFEIGISSYKFSGTSREIWIAE